MNLNIKQIFTIICSVFSILSVVLSISALRKPFQTINYNGTIFKPVIYSDSIIYTNDVSTSGYFQHFNSDQSVVYIHVTSIISEIVLCIYITIVFYYFTKPMREKYETIDYVTLVPPFGAFALLIAASAVSRDLNVDICEDIGQCVNFKLKSNHQTIIGDTGLTYNSYSKSSIGYNLIITSTVMAGLGFACNLARFYLLKNRI
ncbi:hypothetical protein DICPUDRAFT_79505 [Dictyostelium purpureum]|uniref:Uncharacterized protein n=1 Tax=Dictyostelium purpureum TaxID=5786 RepID=F0ZMS9_DICPU|nr:uncharacterized protein DICPUDRAFT_79505 [Dictyostelium purpureum]EGC34756.1 hypothetical protein DICPUDRAFT_79505 [Dictyostelium purpureum]|eukprot:XP_003288718.1 hypothetical protein DICPUDRAFT_79505 [Dictyostelium purpureum]